MFAYLQGLQCTIKYDLFKDVSNIATVEIIKDLKGRRKEHVCFIHDNGTYMSLKFSSKTPSKSLRVKVKSFGSYSTLFTGVVDAEGWKDLLSLVVMFKKVEQ